MNRVSLILLLLASCSAAAGQVLFKIGARGQERLAEFLNLPIIAGSAFYLAGMVMWIYVLSSEKLTDVYAFTALTFVLVYVAGVVVVGEKLVASTVVGIILVLFGLYLIIAKPGLGWQ